MAWTKIIGIIITVAVIIIFGVGFIRSISSYNGRDSNPTSQLNTSTTIPTQTTSNPDTDITPVSTAVTATANPTPSTTIPDASVSGTSGGLLQTVKARGHLVCGVNADLPGFGSFDNVRKNWSGFDVDFCRAVAAAIFGDANAVDFVATSADDRFEAIRSGKVDVLFRNTTWTAGRDTKEQLDFGPTTFHDGQGFMVRKNANITRINDLANKQICVEGSTTTEQNLRGQLAALNISFTPRVFENISDVYNNYDQGRCDAVTSDLSQLAVKRVALQEPDNNVILKDIISREPLGPAFIQNDSQWRDIVSWTVFATFYGEEQGVNQGNVVNVQQTTTNPNIKRLLGIEGTLGQDLGIPNDFGFKIIQQVGNYEDIYKRNLGPSTPFNLDRGPNKIWNRGEGGVLSSPPF